MNHLEVRLVAELFLFPNDESDDEDGAIQKLLTKIEDYAESTIPRYNHRQFVEHFRMSTGTFEIVLQKLHSIIVQHQDARMSGNPELSLRKQLLITVWYLANIESFRSVADRFGVSKSTAWMCVNKICKDLLYLNETQKIITTNLETMAETSNYFREKTNFPGIVGIIDGSHIPLKAPELHPTSYINRKGYHSVVLQGVCDHKRKFIDCYAGEVGSMHDARVLRRSDFGTLLETVKIPDDGHFIGHSAYPLKSNLLVPYKDNGHLTNIQRHYNTVFAKARVTIEHTFALLKGRFRRLNLVETRRIEMVPQIIVVSCILHNICRDTEDEVEINLNRIIREEMQMRPENIGIEERQERRGVEKRNNIANYLYMRR
ncbi:hypothetical protein NQ315_000473 [Exocentrus adspersus]|uniref:DDE Tnp4 domain-containing protein n=1 Tax=Exocentrus adspersus TaxID=1586481 RepID=A0AAV8VEQ3_9CUCU|nr:hypothetical protein NQ315_000473 [Exocentrus adspersus]